jgi:hypothetical protein
MAGCSSREQRALGNDLLIWRPRVDVSAAAVW